jgi:hypothetical protein
MAKVSITARALSQRINRKLNPEKLRAARGKQRHETGDYFITYAKGVKVTHVFLEKLGRDLGVLHDWEVLEKTATDFKKETPCSA